MSKIGPHGLLHIPARAGIGRTWAMCHALLMGGTDQEVFELAEFLYRREASRCGWKSDGQLDSYRNFDKYVQRLKDFGIDAWKDEKGIWHARILPSHRQD